jgi:sulfate transport system permease protein
MTELAATPGPLRSGAEQRGRPNWRPRSILPGFGLGLGVTLTYLSLIVLIPLAGVFFRAAELDLDDIWRILTSKRVLGALELSFGTAFLAATINAVFGALVAWVFVRYSFPGKRVADAIIDLPFALPTAVAGIALTAIYAKNGWFGQYLEAAGFKLVFAPAGIVVALTFIGLPFVVRTLQPVLEDAERELEEAAAALGANRLQTVVKVILPLLIPAWLTGFALAFARGVGEYGSVIFIAGNLPMKTEIAPLLIIIKLEEFDYAGATLIAATMLVVAFVLLLLINLLQTASARHRRGR